MTDRPTVPLGIELAAAITRSTTVLAAFREEDDHAEKYPMAPRPDWRSHCFALAAALAKLTGRGT
jgi:hypothetical protein